MAYKLQTARSGATALPEKMLDFLSLKLIDASGVANLTAGELLVKEKPAPALKVLVTMGAAFLKLDDGSMVYPVNLEVEDAELTITANASGNPRIDAVVLYIDLAAVSNADSTNVAKLVVVAGSPSASPVSPSDAAISASIGASDPFIRLADVYVANGDTTITNSNITDTREQIALSDVFNQDFEYGDVKFSAKSSLSGRFLRMNGDTIGNLGSGADHESATYKNLFDLLVSLGQTTVGTWAGGGTVELPLADDRFIAVAGGAYSVLTTGGSNTHVHTTGDFTLLEAHIPSHTHIQDAHTHTQVAHSHSVTDPGHIHTIPFQNGDQDGSGSNGALNGGATNSGNSVTGISLGNATPVINGTVAVNQETGGDTAHNHGNTGSTSHVPKYIALYAFMRY